MTSHLSPEAKERMDRELVAPLPWETSEEEERERQRRERARQNRRALQQLGALRLD